MEIVNKLAAVLEVSTELLLQLDAQQIEREQAYEYGLPEFLQHDWIRTRRVWNKGQICWTVSGESFTVVLMWQR